MTYQGLSRFENLKTLIARTEGVSILFLTQAIRGFKKLQVLILENEFVQNFHENLSFLSNMKQLKTLALKNYLSANDDVFIQVGLNCPALSYIDISGIVKYHSYMTKKG